MAVFHILNNDALLHRRISNISERKESGAELRPYSLMSMSFFFFLNSPGSRIKASYHVTKGKEKTRPQVLGNLF